MPSKHRLKTKSSNMQHPRYCRALPHLLHAHYPLWSNHHTYYSVRHCCVVKQRLRPCKHLPARITGALACFQTIFTREIPGTAVHPMCSPVASRNPLSQDACYACQRRGACIRMSHTRCVHSQLLHLLPRLLHALVRVLRGSHSATFVQYHLPNISNSSKDCSIPGCGSTAP